ELMSEGLPSTIAVPPPTSWAITACAILSSKAANPAATRNERIRFTRSPFPPCWATLPLQTLSASSRGLLVRIGGHARGDPARGGCFESHGYAQGLAGLARDDVAGLRPE